MLEPNKVKIPVGSIIKTHGIHGELNIELSDYAEPNEDFAPGACIIIEIDGLDVPFFIDASRSRGPNSLLISLADINSETEARQLVGQTIYIYADPSQADELTAGELIGYEIIDVGVSIGKIQDLIELTPGSWYFQLPNNKLIPATDDLIRNIDHQNKTVEMDLPLGLLEL